MVKHILVLMAIVIVILLISQTWKSYVDEGFITNIKRAHRNPIIYQGHGIPLVTDEYDSLPNQNESMFYFEKYACHPSCCAQSTYSCSNGCVCWSPKSENDPYVKQMSEISPRS
jgi:hypothetical protein